MATTAVAVKRPVHPDRIFFPMLCGLMLLLVWFGFSKTYYAAGMVHAKLPSPTIHVHAIAATLWLITLIVQIGLVSARKVKLHMTVGLWGFGLAAGWVVIAMAAALDALRRNMSPPGSGLDPLTFFIVPVTGAGLFAWFAGWSYMARRTPLAHKRLIMIATIAILDAAVGRFPYTVWPSLTGLKQSLVLFVLLAAIMVYDLITLRRIHRATWIPAVALIVVHLTRIPFAQTHLWMRFAAMCQG